MTATTGPKISSWAMTASRSHVGEDVGPDVEAAAGPAAGRRFGDEHRPALALALLDVGLDRLLRLGRDHGPHAARGVVGRADDHGARRVDEALDELVVGALQDDDARGRRALLPLEVEGAHDALEDGHVEVGVGVDDQGVLAAHLGDHALHASARRVCGRRFDDVQADVL